MSVILGVLGDSVVDEGGSNTGDVTLTAVGSTPTAAGASLSGQQLTLQPADATHPGVVTTGAQTVAGSKTFNSTILSSAGLVSESNGLNPMGLKGGKADASDAVGCYSDTVQAYATGGAKIHSFRNNTTEKASVDLSGKYQTLYTDGSGTPGNATANTPTGRHAIAASASAATITSSCCNAASVVLVQLEDNDTTATKVKVVPASGSFVVTANANATAATKFRWIIFN